MAKESGATYASIKKQADGGKYASVYLLMGDEDYYIDMVSQYIVDKALKPEERDFNLDILYGGDTNANAIANAARQYPIMAEHRVVMVREFQSLHDKETLASYVKNPTPTTILILCNKHGAMEKGKTLLTEIRKNGTVMVSNRLYDNQLPSFVVDYMRDHGLTIEPQATQMLCDHVGSDLTRLTSEMDKLRITIPQGETAVKASLVEKLTGVSKDYNNFELQDALARRDILKANKIANYFAGNPKNFSLPLTLATMFSLFAEVMQAYYAPEQTDRGIAQWLGKTEWQARQVTLARRNYKAAKVIEIISQIRETDAKSKGVEGCRTPSGELLRELIFFILH